MQRTTERTHADLLRERYRRAVERDTTRLYRLGVDPRRGYQRLVELFAASAASSVQK